MKYPSWSEVNVPNDLVHSIKLSGQGYFIDSLVYQLLFFAKRKAVYGYSCGHCDFRWKPERSYEEINSCQKCHSPRIYCNSIQYRFSKQVPQYSKICAWEDIIAQYEINHFTHFGAHPKENYIDVGWDKEGYAYAQIEGGERVNDFSQRVCLLKAFVLCPYLWDNNVIDMSAILYNFNE